MIRFDSHGWRARLDEDFNEESVSRIAEAIGAAWEAVRPGGTAYVGYDARRGAERLACVAAGILASHGLRVRASQEPLPIPVLGWGVSQDGSAVGGLMLTASEAPADYGGICLRGPDGGPAPEDLTLAIERSINALPLRPAAAFERVDLVGPYVDDAVGHLVARPLARAPRVVLDPLHGAAGRTADLVLEGIGCEVLPLHEEPRPDFGGLRPSPREPWTATCQAEVVSRHADLGVVLDGDGDRLGVVGDAGECVPAHLVECLVMEHLVRESGMSGAVVVNQACSSLVSRQARRLGCPVRSVPVGFRRIYEEFGGGGVLMGTEHLGGTAFPWHLRERDAVYVAGLLCALLGTSGEPLSARLEDLEEKVGRTYFSRRDVRTDVGRCETLRNLLPGVNPRELYGEEPTRVSHAEGLKVEFGDGSWVMVRTSRTEPVVRVWAEAASASEADSLVSTTAAGIAGL